jgi:hypothetical protein
MFLMRPSPASLVSAALLAVAAGGALSQPVAARAKAKPKLYVISLSGSAGTSLNTVKDGIDDAYGGNHQVPDGCLASNTTTYHWAATARVGVKPRAIPVSLDIGGGRYFYLNATMSSLSTSVYDQVDGSWAVDPTWSEFHPDEPPPDPSTCVFTPFRVASNCALKGGRASLHTPLQLVPRGATFSIEHNDPADGQVVQCPTHPTATGVAPGAAAFGGYFLDGMATQLGVRAVFALAKGRSLSVSGTTVKPHVWWDGKIDGNETVTYRLQIKRVQ